MANATPEQVGAGVKSFMNDYGGASATNVTSFGSDLDMTARQWAAKNCPPGVDKADFTKRVLAGISKVRHNANRYQRDLAAYNARKAAGNVNPSTGQPYDAFGNPMPEPTYSPYSGVEGATSKPSSSGSGNNNSGGNNSGGGSSSTDADGNGVPDDEEPTADPDYNVDDEFNDEDLDDNFSGPDGSWRKPAASTVGQNMQGTPTAPQGPEDTDRNHGLTTEFEQSGIVADRHLAVAPISNWKKGKPEPGGSTGYRGKCLADNLNYAAARINKSQVGNGPSREQRGYVVRAIPYNTDKTFFDQVVEMAYETSGAGGQHTQLAQVFSRHDRFGRSMVPRNAVFSGYTFFTRPRLCLRDYNICADRKFSVLRTLDNTSVPFAIRCLLDPQFAKDTPAADNCPLFDLNNPFLVPLCNAVKSVSGFNDPALVTETTEGGFFSEDQTYVIGGDRLARTYDINCMFRDFPGSPILAIVDYWCQYMANLTDGSMNQYADAIDLNRMDYTVSIYRFLMDRTNRYIARWSKCTGCFPVSPPSGIAFNLNEGEFMVNAAAELNVPFKANRIEYDDPVILKEFNMLVRRYANDGINSAGLHSYSQVAQNNFAGIPYIRPADDIGMYELLWMARGKEGENPIFTGGPNLNSRVKTIGNDVL